MKHTVYAQEKMKNTKTKKVNHEELDSARYGTLKKKFLAIVQIFRIYAHTEQKKEKSG